MGTRESPALLLLPRTATGVTLEGSPVHGPGGSPATSPERPLEGRRCVTSETLLTLSRTAPNQGPPPGVRTAGEQCRRESTPPTEDVSPAASTRSRECWGSSFQGPRRGSREKGPSRTQGLAGPPGCSSWYRSPLPGPHAAGAQPEAPLQGSPALAGLARPPRHILNRSAPPGPRATPLRGGSETGTVAP